MPGEVECQHCGSTIRTKRPDLRKWCDRCGALKALLQLRAKVHKCVVCSARYYAHDNTSARARVRICPGCSGVPVGETRDTMPCAFCDGKTRLLPGVALCYLCAVLAEPESRSVQVVKAAARKLKEVARGG